MKYLLNGNRIEITDTDSFDIEEILECGQCFRFKRTGEKKYRIIALNRVLNIEQTEDKVIFYPCSKEDFENLWSDYFDFDTDYSKIKKIVSQNDPIMQKAVEYAGGIRLLNQEPFETLISFIISQNNNIPRIKGIIGRLAEKYGIAANEEYLFPKRESLINADIEDYMSVGTGFRAKYLSDCISKLESGEIVLEDIVKKPTSQARDELLKIKGVGPKVADCVLLFSLKKREVFPVDVWVKRVMESLYFNGKETSIKSIGEFAAKKWGEYAGYAQQYLFYYARSEKIGL